MSKTLTEATISTRSARAKLPQGVHWRGINADIHLGYRKGKRAGRWLVRWYVGNQRYQQETIGVADDALEADGVDCLTFDQAKSKAPTIVAMCRAEQRAAAAGPIPTVLSVVENYMASRDAKEASRNGRAVKSDARHRLTKHVVSSPIASLYLHALTESDLSEWREGLPDNLSPATVRRLVNDFKAALNAGAIRFRSSMPAELPLIIKNGLRVNEATPPVARDKQALSDADVRRIIEAAVAVDTRDEWEGDLSRLVIVLAATGARFSQVCRMAVGDVQTSQTRLMVPVSRKGRGTKAATHIAVRVGSDVIASLRPAIAGRRASEPLLERWRHKQIKNDQGGHPRWVRDSRGPWMNSTELTRPWLEITKIAGLPADVVPYALRHSSIVRQLRSGLPVRLVAALHDTSTRMIETHYAAAIVDALDDLSAGAVVPLVPSSSEKVVKLIV